MSRTGLMFTFESEETFRGAAYAFDLRKRNGVRMDLLDGNEARQVQPALSPNVVHAWRVADFSHTLDPLRLVQALEELFRQRGGTFRRTAVHGFEIDGAHGVRAYPHRDRRTTPVERWSSRPASGRESSPRRWAPTCRSKRSGDITPCTTALTFG